MAYEMFKTQVLTLAAVLLGLHQRSEQFCGAN